MFNGSQTFYTVIANVVHDAATFIQQAEIPPAYYDSKNTDYAPNWINTPPLVTGVANGFVEEAKDIPALIVFGADFAMNEQVRTQLWKSLSKLKSWEGVKTVASSTLTDWTDNYTQGDDHAWH